jgi:hypothetical protein
MSEPDFENLPTRLGVYTLTELLGRGEYTDLYQARQSHVERGVVVQVLRPGADKTTTDYFLNVVRARGATALPGISQVLESKMAGQTWYLAHERPEGSNLAQLAATGGRLSTAQACAVIATVARMYATAARQNIAMEPLSPYTIYVKENDSVRVLSPVLCGEYDPAATGAHMQALAAALYPVLPQNVPGQGRVATLVQWIDQGYEGQFLDWDAISATAEEINTQTAPLLTRSEVEHLSSGNVGRQVRLKQELRRRRRHILCLSAAALFVGLMGAAGALLLPGEGEQLPECSGRYLYVQAEQGPRRVLLRPVSILEYQRFLNVYEDPAATNQFRRAAINEGIPADCTNHTPAQWQQQLESVDSGKPWNGEKLTMRSPVRGVSYWDALAYANFHGAELPSAAVVLAAREQAGTGTPLPEEWSSTTRPADMLYAEGQVLLPATGGKWQTIEPERTARNLNRSFRILLPVSRNSD